jgi:hypothetical protein
LSEAAEAGLTETPGADESIPVETTEPAQSGDRSDYEARLRSDPEFALSEVKKWQATADRRDAEAKARLKKFESLEPWVDNLGGPNAVLGYMGRFGALLGNPAMREAVEMFERTGSVPALGATASGADTTEEYLDPAERKIKELEGQLAGLREQFSRGESRQAQQSLKGQMDRLFEKYPYLNDEEKAQIVSRIDGQIKQWDQTEEGRRIIGSLNYDALEIVAAPVIVQKIEEIGERAYRKKLEKKQGAATEAAPARQTNGQAMSATAKSAAGALREFMRERGLTEFGPDMGRR